MKLTYEEFKVLIEALASAKATIETLVADKDGSVIKEHKKETLDKIEKAKELVISL
jgi:hypothetical protein